MTTLSVVIPAYNEEKGIADIIQRVLAVRETLMTVGINHLELIIVDDGSRDRTAQIATDIAREEVGVRLIRHTKNGGYGAALKTGFSQACGELIGFLDADGTYPPESFPQLCKSALDGNDLVVGSRMSGAESRMPITRRIGNLFFAGLLTLIGGQKVKDSASGMRVFKRCILSQVYPLPNGLNLTPVMSTRAIHEGIKIAEVPIPYSERLGRSKLSVIRDGSIFLQSIIWTALTYNPIRIFGLVGLAGLTLAGVTVITLFITRLSGITSISPWWVAALYAALVSAVTGISLFSLGATFNYLVSLFHKRPIRQGLFGHPIFNPSLDHYFGWIGVVGFLGGLCLSLVSLSFALNGWGLERLWLYLLGGAMLILIGVQLIIYWVLMRVLEELSHSVNMVEKDLDLTKTPEIDFV